MITIENGIKQEIAQRVVEQAHPGYSKGAQGEWYVVDGSSVVHKSENAAWEPWSDDATVISVEDLVNLYGGGDDENADFSGWSRSDIDWETFAPEYSVWEVAFLTAHNDEPAEASYEVASWAYENLDGASAVIDRIEREQADLAVEFALGYVPDEYDDEDYAARYGE